MKPLITGSSIALPRRRREAPQSARRGQTLILALAVLFLLVFLGAIFVSVVLRNMQRVTRFGGTDDAVTLALAGLQHAARQFRNSERGVDWRPQSTEDLWKTPQAPNISVPVNPPHPLFGAALDGTELRVLDPDNAWLSDNGTFRNPYVRFRAGNGRFLLRVSYTPRYRPAGAESERQGLADEFDRNSRMVHIEVVGRPGEFDPNDPSFFDPTRAISTRPRGVFRKLEAWVPVGLVDQLWWVTNAQNRRGPADLGVPPFQDGTGNLVEYPTVFHGGGILANTSVRWNGRNVVNLYPARGEGILVKGRQTFAPRANHLANPGQPTSLRVQVLDDGVLNMPLPGSCPPGAAGTPIPPDNHDLDPANDTIVLVVDEGESGTPGFNPIPLLNAGCSTQFAVLDEAFTRGAPSVAAQSTRLQAAPSLLEPDATTGIPRFYRLTRDSGGTLEVPDAGGNRLINAGVYGLTDAALPPEIRSKGLYVDNAPDIQYPNDRERVRREEWLQRRRGWLGETYIPSVEEAGTLHPITEVVFTSVPGPGGTSIPKIRVTRFDSDTRQRNLSPATGRQRLFYEVAGLNVTGARGAQASLVPVGHTRLFDYPENGVMFLEGSVRVRGTVGNASFPRQLTLVSGGTIYIEGNILKGHPGSALGLLAEDWVTLNPTAFTRIQPGEDIVVEASEFDDNGRPIGYHFSIPPGGDLDVATAAGDSPGTGLLLHVKHSAPAEDANSRTRLVLFDAAGNRYDFGSSIPAFAPPPPPPPYPNLPYSGASALFYLFHNLDNSRQRDPTASDPINWHESRFQSASANSANWERKTFFLPAGGAPGVEQVFRFFNSDEGETFTDQNGNGAWDQGEPFADENGNGRWDPAQGGTQPYWLSRVALIPEDRPLPIRIQAVLYAFSGSWFVIPPPFFNENPADTRDAFEVNGRRARGTFPRNTPAYPFYNEPLNVDIELLGAVSENMPAAPADQAAWTRALWRDPLLMNNTPNAADPTYRPGIRYRFDETLRYLVRARIVGTGREVVALSLPPGVQPNPPLPGVPYLDDVILQARTTENSFVETLPVLPNLPAGAIVYEGNPL